jgi:hypothetical protein
MAQQPALNWQTGFGLLRFTHESWNPFHRKHTDQRLLVAMNTNQVDLFVHQPATETSSAALQIFLKLLDWPFLMAVVLIVFIFVFRKQIKAVLNRGDILIKWGDQSIQLRELEDSIDKEIDPLRDQLETLKQTKQNLSEAKASKGVQFANIQEPPVDALARMKEALQSPDYRWRTVSRLASIACISEDEAKSLLRADPEIVFSIGKSGNSIAKLKSR